MLSPDKVLNKGYTQEELALGSPFAVALKHNMMNCKKNLATVLAEAAQARAAAAPAAHNMAFCIACRHHAHHVRTAHAVGCCVNMV